MIVFVHIEKAAGTTLNHILRCNFPLTHIDVRPFSSKSNSTFQPEDLKIALKINPFLKSISGHSIRPFIPLSPIYQDLKYITVLRDPVQRYISRFYYLKNKFYPSLTFTDFLSDESTYDFQIKKITGSTDIEKAITILENNFFLVGLTEEFDTFLLLLQTKLRSIKFNPHYKPQNTALHQDKYKKLKRQVTQEFYKDIIERNRADIELYQYVKNNIFRKEKELLGNKLDENLKKFQQECTKFKWPMARYIDYLYRKLYIDPLTGIIRLKNGLSYKGSY